MGGLDWMGWIRKSWIGLCVGLFFLEQSTSQASLSFVTSMPPSPLQSLCKELELAMVQLKWKMNPCDGVDWKVGGQSVQGRPLIYSEFGDDHAENVTLVFATVHGDEVTPLYLAMQLALWLQERKSLLINTKVIVAPLVNPDGFLSKPRTRMNSNGVDINRNFSTKDWQKRALLAWKTKYKADKRRFPGLKPGSEPETIFQVELINKSKPQKVLSIHSPLNFLDYDGPSALTLSQFPNEYARECEKLRKSVKAISSGFFPGSLGNYAGRELGIPTLTLELPSADPSQADRYWRKFSDGIRTMIHFSVPKYASEGRFQSGG